MSDREFEIYPAEEKCLYFIEFSRWPGKKLEYRLFKRSYIYSKEEFAEILKGENSFLATLMGREGHPYQLLSGTVIEQNCVSFETKEFLKFTVDSLNKNSHE